MRPMSDPLFSVRGLASGYGDVQILWDIDIDVPEGEITCIVGSNGAGKTTLLNTIAGLVPATAGQILFQGTDITRAKPHEVLGAGIALVPEGRRLFKGLSVRDNLLLGAYLRREPAKVIEQEIDFICSIFPILKERHNQDATTLSGGEQQMCAIGRGIMSRPKLLMIDELSLGLAPRAVDRLCDALTEINKLGISVLLVEQDVMTAFDLAEHAFVVETGRIRISGRTDDLSDNADIRQAYFGF